MSGGQVKERGSYKELAADGNDFANLMKEYGVTEDELTKATNTTATTTTDDTQTEEKPTEKTEQKPGKGAMPDEERAVGGIPLSC